MKKAGVVLLSVAVIAVIVGYLMMSRSQGSDEEQIIALMERGRQAIEAKKLSPAASCLSKDYSDENGLNYEKLRILAAQAFRSKSRYELAVETPRIEVIGDEATAQTHVSLNAYTMGVSNQVFSDDVTLRLKRESVRRFLILPRREWKVTEIIGLSGVLDKIE